MIHRGQIWWVDFAEPRGSEPGFRHPALVLQRDEVNASRISTVVVCVLTSNRALAGVPGNTLLSKQVTGLPRDSVANASQIATVNKADLEALVATLPGRVMGGPKDARPHVWPATRSSCIFHCNAGPAPRVKRNGEW